MRLDLLVMLVNLALSAAAQDLLPGLPGTPLKIPILMGMVVYYALNRPLVMAAVAGLWAGWLTDGAGCLPGACTSTFLLLLAMVLRLLKTMLMDGSFAGVIVAATASALLQALWQLSWTRLALPGETWRVVGDLALLLPSGAIAGVIAFGMGRFLDQCAGNVRPREEVHGPA